MDKNIVLCGFMGCGKSTLGPLLASRLQMEFVDMDGWIEETQGRSIPEIFRESGEGRFRDLEHQAVLCLSRGTGQVISTGGGAMAFSRNIAPLRRTGVVLYLDPGFAECYRRIRQSDRPLVQANTQGQLEELYRVRDGHYRAAAHHRLSLEGGPQEWLAAALEAVGAGE